MTELQFKQHFLNDKGELIFQFSAMTNIFKEIISQRYDGDVIVNLTAKAYYISERALEPLRANFATEVYAELKAVDEKCSAWNIAYRDKKCDEKVAAMLFKVCEELKEVIC